MSICAVPTPIWLLYTTVPLPSPNALAHPSYTDVICDDEDSVFKQLFFESKHELVMPDIARIKNPFD